MTKTIKKSVSIIIICSVMIIAVIAGILIVPSLLKSRATTYSEACYPEYTFEELTNTAGEIAYCKVLSVQPARWTKDVANDVITTDYVMGRLDADGIIISYFILRTSGGTVGNKTNINSTDIKDQIQIGGYYVLFMSKANESSEENNYRVNGEDIDFQVYYHVISGPSGIFTINDSEISDFQGKSEKIAENNNQKYNISYNDLFEVVFEKST